MVAARTCGDPGDAGQSTSTTSAVPSAGSAAVSSPRMSLGCGDGDADAGGAGAAGGAGGAGGSAFDDGGNGAGICPAAPAVMNRDKAPSSTPGRMARQLFFFMSTPGGMLFILGLGVRPAASSAI